MNNVLPKLRFSHFNNKWSKRAFYILVSRVSETTDLVDLPRVEFEDIVSGLGTLNKDINNKKSDKKGIKFNSGDILFGKLRPYLKNWLFADFQGIAIGDFWVLRPNDTDGYFIYALIQGPKYQRVANLSTGTKMPRSDWKTVSETKFSVPLHIEEQQKIGEFFKQLDDRIALQQRHVEQLKQSKQGFLQKMFPKDGESVPEVRVEGFSGDWEEVTLGDVATFSKGKGLSKNEFSDEGVPCLHYGELFTTYDDNINDVDTYTDIDESSMVYSDGSEVLVPSSSTVADKAVTASAINIAGVMIGGDINIIKPNSILNNSFLSLLINYGYRNKVWTLVQTGTITHLYNKDLKRLRIRIPSLEEQQKIGDFFKQLDELIAKNERELELLQETKKGFLQKMFV